MSIGPPFHHVPPPLPSTDAFTVMGWGNMSSACRLSGCEPGRCNNSGAVESPQRISLACARDRCITDIPPPFGWGNPKPFTDHPPNQHRTTCLSDSRFGGRRLCVCLGGGGGLMYTWTCSSVLNSSTSLVDILCPRCLGGGGSGEWVGGVEGGGGEDTARPAHWCRIHQSLT